MDGFDDDLEEDDDLFDDLNNNPMYQIPRPPLTPWEKVKAYGYTVTTAFLNWAEGTKTPLERYTLRAEKGDLCGRYNLGVVHLNGEGTKKDETKAFHEFKLAADAGHAMAQFNIGEMYAQGKGGVGKDPKKAIEYFQRASDQGDMDAQYNLGVIYFNGEGCIKDHKKAYDYFLLAAGQGECNAQFVLGLMHSEGYGLPKDKKKACEWWTISAAQDDWNAQYELALLYLEGDGVPKDVQRAFTLVREAAVRGHYGAIFQLGLFYTGTWDGIERDDVKAHGWLTISANKGHPGAQFQLGLMYEGGLGCKESREKAKSFYKKAASQKLPLGLDAYGVMCMADGEFDKALECFSEAAKFMPRAIFHLGELYDNEEWDKRDEEKAFDYYKKAASQDDPEGLFVLGQMQYAGEGGFEPDPVKAVEIFRKAAEFGNDEACFNLGTLYFSGEGVGEKDINKAVEWFEIAAKLGNPDALNNLGFLYQNGDLPQDYEKALLFYTQALDGGSAAGAFGLGVLYEEGLGRDVDLKTAAKFFKIASDAGLEESQPKDWKN